MSEEGGSPSALAWLVILLFVLSCALVVLSALLERSGPIRLRHWVREAGGRLERLYSHPAQFEAFRYLLSFGAKLLPVMVGLALVELLRELEVKFAGPIALGGVILLLAGVEFANRALVWHDPEAALRRLTPIYRAILGLLLPLVLAVSPLFPFSTLLRREEEVSEDEATDEEIEAFIDVGTREGILEPEERDLLWGIVDFGDTQVRSVMTPRIDMVCAPMNLSLEELADRFVESRHSRIPLYEGSIDHIVGILHIRDLLAALRSADPPASRELAKPPLFIPETKALDELLKELQARSQQMAIVVDEYGGTAGLVTIEDLVEEIVGEITDEDEEQGTENRALPDGSWILDGRTHLEELEEIFGIEIGETPFETVGGMIFTYLGHVPVPGEVVECYGLRFGVEQVTGRRVRTVRVEKLSASQEQEAKKGP